MVLRELHEYCAQHGNLSTSLASDKAVRLLAGAWRDRWPDAGPPAPTLHDAVTALQLLDHSLRPLCYPPVPADLGHAVANGLSLLPALAAKWRHGVPVLLTEHGVYLREQYLQHRRSPYRWPVKALYLRFLRLPLRDRLSGGGGHHAGQRLQQAVGGAARRGADADQDRVQRRRPGVLPRRGRRARRAHDLVGGPDRPDQGPGNAAARVRPGAQGIPAARLRLFGSAPQGGEAYLQRCQALAAELGIAGAATFEGRVADIRDAYQAGSIVVLCSVSEGFPYSLIEAMTCGRACVATDVGGVTEALGDTGLVVPPRSPERLARACLTLLRDDSMRRRLGSAARARALEYFTVDEAINTFDEIYHFLGSGQPMPTAPLRAAAVPTADGSAAPPVNGSTERDLLPWMRRPCAGTGAAGLSPGAATGTAPADGGAGPARGDRRTVRGSSPPSASPRWIRWRSAARWSSRAGATRRPGTATGCPTCSRWPSRCTCGCRAARPSLSRRRIRGRMATAQAGPARAALRAAHGLLPGRRRAAGRARRGPPC